MHWVIKTAKSAIGVVDPAPYFAGWVIGWEPTWTRRQKDAVQYSDASSAIFNAKIWGPSWRDAVRVVRLVRKVKT